MSHEWRSTSFVPDLTDAPPVPANVSAKAISPWKIRLGWDDGARETSYRVWRWNGTAFVIHADGLPSDFDHLRRFRAPRGQAVRLQGVCSQFGWAAMQRQGDRQHDAHHPGHRRQVEGLRQAWLRLEGLELRLSPPQLVVDRTVGLGPPFGCLDRDAAGRGGVPRASQDPPRQRDHPLGALRDRDSRRLGQANRQPVAQAWRLGGPRDIPISTRSPASGSRTSPASEPLPAGASPSTRSSSPW